MSFVSVTRAVALLALLGLLVIFADRILSSLRGEIQNVL